MKHADILIWCARKDDSTGHSERKKVEEVDRRLEDNVKEWTGMDSVSSTRSAENSTICKRNCCKVICGAQTTLHSQWIDQNRLELTERYQRFSDRYKDIK